MVPDRVFMWLRMLLEFGLLLAPEATGKHWLGTGETGRIKRFCLNLVVLMIQFSKSGWKGLGLNLGSARVRELNLW